MADPPKQPDRSRDLDLSDDWDPEDPVLSEMPEASPEAFLAGRRSTNQSPAPRDDDEAKPIVIRQAPEPVERTEAEERATFESDPDKFLKSLAILETTLRLRQKHGSHAGQPASKEDLMRLAMTTLEALPIDVESHAEFLVHFVAKAIGETREESDDFDRFRETLEESEAIVMKPSSVARVDIPAETSAAMNEVAQTWGSRSIDLGVGTVRFDEGRAMLEDLQQLPGVGRALVSKDIQLRKRFLLTLWWSSIVVAFALLVLLLINIQRWSSTDVIETKDEPSLIDESLYLEPDLDALEITLKGFVGAETWQEQLEHVRHPEIMMPKMEAHYASGAPFQWGKSYTIIRADLEIISDVPQVLCLIELYPTQEMRALLVELKPDGKYLVDWEYAELWQEEPWDAFRQRSDTRPATMLVVMRPGRYYNFTYKDSKAYQCWELLDPAEKGLSFFGYAKQDSSAGETLRRIRNNRIIERKPTTFAAILKLQHPENAEDPLQVDILEVVEESALRRHFARD